MDWSVICHFSVVLSVCLLLFRAKMSTSIVGLGWGFRLFVFSAHVFRFFLCSKDSFKWCYGLVGNLLFPSHAHPYVCSFSERRCHLLAGFGWDFRRFVFICPCFLILLAWILMSLLNGAMGWSVLCYFPVVLTRIFAPFLERICRRLVGFG